MYTASSIRTRWYPSSLVKVLIHSVRPSISGAELDPDDLVETAFRDQVDLSDWAIIKKMKVEQGIP